MLIRDHDAFFPPPGNCTIWRYIDFTKFVSLLETQKLFFARADQFEDPYEGTWSSAGVRLLRDPAQNGDLPAQAVEQLITYPKYLQKTMFISCWHASEHESAAMWKLYLQSIEGVAIRTDYDTLAEALMETPLSAGISMVQYIDYENTPIPFRNLFFPFIHKRLSFSHENELRAIIWRDDHINKPQIPAGSASVSVAVSPQQLIKAIHVSPAAPRWFGELVEKIAHRYNLQAPVIRSNLYDRPTF
jgi:hypothetical protein